MIKLFFIPLAVMLSCSSTKSSNADKISDSAKAVSTSTVKNAIGSKNMDSLPTCIKNKIDSFKLKEIHDRPQKVIEYSYKGKKVYYVSMACCDFFNEVYDENCNYLGAPDGGFTGRGDGKLPDFSKIATNEKVIWEPAK